MTQAHYALGVAYLRQGQNKRAQAQFQKVLQLDPAFSDAYNNLGGLLAKQGPRWEATNQFLRALPG